MKLGIGDIIQSAAISIWRGGRPMAICLILWASAALAHEIAQQRYDFAGQAHAAMRVLWESDLLLADVSAYFAMQRFFDRGFGDLVDCVFVAAMLRIILIGTATGRGGGHGSLARAAGGVLVVSLLVTAVTSLTYWFRQMLVNAALSSGVLGFVDGALSLVLVIIIVHLAARLCLVYPSIAVGQGFALPRNWRRTAGNGLRLTVVLAAVLVGSRIADVLSEVYIFRRYEFVPGDLPLQSWSVAAKDAGLAILVATSLMAMAAVAFARLTGFPAVGIPGADKTPQQLAEMFE